MNKGFTDSVQDLYQSVVTQRDAQGHSAKQLLDLLYCRPTHPIRAQWEDHQLVVTYYNVSLQLRDDLSAMLVSYNSDYQLLLHDLTHNNLQQLADFVLALERDIPRWKHLWLSAEQLALQKAKMNQRYASVMHEIQHSLTSEKENVSSEREKQYRIQFYNLKAMQLMLEKDIALWERRRTEEEILDQCMLYHIVPPMEQWYEEWQTFSANCSSMKDERIRKKEELRHTLLKMQHLVQIKKAKINAMLKSIEYHPLVKAEVDADFWGEGLKMIKRGYYRINLSIYNAPIYLDLKFRQIDTCIRRVVEAIQRINDIAPELQRNIPPNMPEDVVYIAATWDGGVRYTKLTLAEYPHNDEDENVSRILDQINSVWEELADSIQ